jgi:hypothetical protein
LGVRWAAAHNIPVKPFPAAWKSLGRQAGYLRNEEMARYADALIAVWDGASNGTRHMIHRATALGLRVLVVSAQNEILFQQDSQPGERPN